MPITVLNVKGGMEMSNLILMVGVPGSGKSTIAKNVLKFAEGANTIRYISRDEIRYDLLEPGDSYFAKENLVMRYFIDEIREGLEEGYDVIADATHLNEASRFKIISRMLGTAASIKAILVDTPIEVVLGRNNNRAGLEKVPETQILKMYTSFEKPTAAEGINEVFTVNSDNEGDGDLWTELYKFIIE